MNSQTDDECAQDLERRIGAYEELEQREHWPGALGAIDCMTMALLVLVLVLGFSFITDCP